MDECELDLIQDSFDVVVLNRCLQFAPDPPNHWLAARQRVQEGGLLIATGLSIFHNPSLHRRRIQQRASQFQNQHGLPLFLHTTKGYLDDADLRQLRANGMRWHIDVSNWRSQIKRLLMSTSPKVGYGLWRADA
jgi:hypothetical protein